MVSAEWIRARGLLPLLPLPEGSLSCPPARCVCCSVPFHSPSNSKRFPPPKSKGMWQGAGVDTMFPAPVKGSTGRYLLQ